MVLKKDIYAQMKRFHNKHKLRIYMYDFMYADTETMSGGFYLQVTITFVEKYKKSLTPGPVPKYWIIFSYIRSEDYESDLNFDEK